MRLGLLCAVTACSSSSGSEGSVAPTPIPTTKIELTKEQVVDYNPTSGEIRSVLVRVFLPTEVRDTPGTVCIEKPEFLVKAKDFKSCEDTKGGAVSFMIFDIKPELANIEVRYSNSYNTEGRAAFQFDLTRKPKLALGVDREAIGKTTPRVAGHLASDATRSREILLTVRDASTLELVVDTNPGMAVTIGTDTQTADAKPLVFAIPLDTIGALAGKPLAIPIAAKKAGFLETNDVLELGPTDILHEMTRFAVATGKPVTFAADTSEHHVLHDRDTNALAIAKYDRVMVRSQTTRALAPCRYEGGYTKQREVATVTVEILDRKAAKSIAKRSFTGEIEACDSSVLVKEGDTGASYTFSPELETIDKWVATFGRT